ncbi:cytochrome C [Pseudomonas sp. CGJS7]|uniref:cytochrome C n=1 Tax=Pseudomonas sp. CGJS7 TaxID=3109348 RepID=UPI00300BDEAC
MPQTLHTLVRAQPLPLLAAALTLALAACSDGHVKPETQAQARPQQDWGGNTPPPPALSPNIPHEISVPQSNPNLQDLQDDFDMFSWQSFVAVNWPADANGNPKQGATIGPNVPTVWENWKESREIFLPGGKTPPPWGQDTPPPAVCNGLGDATLRLTQVGKTPNVLDESGEPFETGPLIDQNGQYVRFAILVNQDMFDNITTNTLYSKAGQQAFGKAANFALPKGSPKVGAIMVKSAWKVMGANDNASRFHTAQALVYTNPDEHQGVKASCKLQTVGLVGLHIAHKTQGEPQWVWSTFEQVDNVPTQGEPIDKAHYNFYNKSCTTCKVNEPPPRPWNPNATNTPPSQIMREIALTDSTKKLNASFQAALLKNYPGTVWANYQLISTQWPTNATNPTDPTGNPAPSFLANTTLETYIQGKVPQASSSCMACHNNATMTNGFASDFTYLLQRAQ